MSRWLCRSSCRPRTRGHRAARRQLLRDLDRVQGRRGAGPGHLHHHVERGRAVVHDPEAHPAVVQAHRDVEVRVRRLEPPAGVVVQHHLAARGDARQRHHRVHGAARHRLGADHRAVGGDVGDERHLAAAGRRDRLRDRRARRGGEPLVRRGHVLSSRFRAAGNSTLLRISRYPGEMGCSDRSVGGAPISCWGSSGSWPPR